MNCWCHISYPVSVEATTEKEAEELAWKEFESIDLNRCDIGDYGTDIAERE